MDIIQGIFGIGGKVIDGVSGHFERQDKIEMVREQGNIEEKLVYAKAEADSRIEAEKRETIRVQGDIDIKKQEIKGQFDLESKKLDNIRANDKEKYDKVMKEMDYNFQKENKRLDYDQEIRREEQKDKSRQVDAQIEIDKQNAAASNERELRRL